MCLREIDLLNRIKEPPILAILGCTIVIPFLLKGMKRWDRIPLLVFLFLLFNLRTLLCSWILICGLYHGFLTSKGFRSRVCDCCLYHFVVIANTQISVLSFSFQSTVRLLIDYKKDFIFIPFLFLCALQKSSWMLC